MRYVNKMIIGRKLAFAVTVAALSFLHVSELYPQSCGLSMQVSSVPVQQLGLADVDVVNFESRALLFTVHIMNIHGTNVDSAQLRVTLNIRLADGTSFPTAVEFTTEPFPVPPGGKTVTNLDIGKTKEIKTGPISYDENAKARVQNIALATGSFPAGTYVFHISLSQLSPLCDAGDEEIEYVLQNPSRVELQQPADGAATNEFPFFEFYHDANRATLTVAELQPGQSREDAITRKPPMLEVELRGQHSFIYSGGRPLEQAKTYVWQVVSKVLVSGGTDNTISSPIWSFTVSNSAGGTAHDAILNQLEEIFGSRYPSIFEQIHRGGFGLTGKYRGDDSPLSQAELLNLLNELRQFSDSAELTFE